MEQRANQSEKCITTTSFGMDINVLKAPMFLYNNFKPMKDKNGNIIKDSEGNVIKYENKTYEWIDSKNIKRKLSVSCDKGVPRQFESDVLFALVGLFIKKNAPFPYNDKEKKYEINVNKVEFSWYELALYLNVKNTGYYIDRMKEAVRILKRTQYTSSENGSLYSKSIGKYILNGENGISLINDYKFKSIKSTPENDEYATDIDNNIVEFNGLILDNLRYEYFKYLNMDLYFDKIPSGIARGLYGYLEANRYDTDNKNQKYIKRMYLTLKYGIPVEFNYIYELKKRLTKPLNHLKKIGYLKDWAYGDELLINDEKEECIYFCFDITTNELKVMLERKKAQQLKLNLDLDNESKDENGNNESKAENQYLKMPNKDLQKELADRGLDISVAYEFTQKYDKWRIIKGIIWFDKQKIDEKIKDKNKPGGLLRFAVETECDICNGYPEIIKFIEDSKKQEQDEFEKTYDNNESKYEKYIESKIESFKKNSEDIYTIIYNTVLNDIRTNIEIKIKQIKHIKGDVSKLEEFVKLQDKSEWFKEMLLKELKIYLKIETFDEFKNNESKVENQ